jgi:hypothetical protein
LHHYGSGINAIPVLDAYRRHPDDLYLLRVGYGGVMGSITGIDEQGFGSAAFHSYPDRMVFDPYTGDYGPNFFGHVWNAAAYLVHDKEFGWQGFGGNVHQDAEVITIEPRDTMRQRVYLAPLGLWLQLDAGTFRAVHFDFATHAVKIDLDPADANTAAALLRIEQPATIAGVGTMRLSKTYTRERGGDVIPLGKSIVTIDLVSDKSGQTRQ